jgi:hypothetical protein
MFKQPAPTSKLPGSKSSRGSVTRQGGFSTGSQGVAQPGRMTPPISDQAQVAQEGTVPEVMTGNPSIVAESLIAQRAYEIWESQGGSDLENWLKAERELRGQSASAT